MTELAACTWAESEADLAIRALAIARGMRSATKVRAPSGGLDVERAAACLGLEAEPVTTELRDVSALVARAAPALLRLGSNGHVRLVALVRADRRGAWLVGPNGTHRVPAAELALALGGPLETSASRAVDALLDRAHVAPGRRAYARAGLLREQIGGRVVGGIWLLRTPPTASLRAQLRDAGVMRGIAIVLGAHVAQYVIAMAGWWTIGSAALEGHVDRGWLLAWGLLLATLIPLRLVELLAQGRVAVDAAALVKRRLLEGALRLEPDEMRAEGAGQLLGRTLEANVIESLATSRGVGALMAVVDVAVAAVVLGLGAAPLLSLLTLAAWIGIAAALALRYAGQRAAWTDARLGLTHDLVERMVGHRTRAAQQSSDHWHQADDHELAVYHERSRALDRSSILLTVLGPAGFMLFGLAALAPALVSGATGAGRIAVSIGGVILGFRALQRIAAGSRDLATVAIAWRRVRLLFDSGGRADPVPATAMEPAGATTSATSSATSDPDAPVLSAQGLVFRYRRGAEPVLRGCDLRVAQRDRILLEGPSGGGKSTFALVLAGVRTEESGTLLVNGLDRHTTGPAEWRRRVIAVPQFHENHVVSSTFAFNLLMGHAWPPTAESLGHAEEICRELGLGELLDRMPAGLEQSVGETGWQLSHGERSRLFIARALLQSPSLMVLDESFAALDPVTMRRALECVTRRARALLVVAHP